MSDQFINIISLHKTEIIVGIIIVLAAYALIFLFRNLFRKLWHLIFPPSEKKMEKDNKLYQHFKDIKQEATKIVDSCINLTNYYGMMLIKNIGLTVDWGDYIDKYGVGLLPQPSIAFAAHFPKEADKLAKYRKGIEEHNNKRIDLDSKIQRDFESRNISVVRDSSTRAFYIYDAIFQPLFKWWQDRNHKIANPWPNFNKIETRSDGGPDNLFAHGWGSQAIAYARTDSGKQKCKSAIRKVANNTEYQQEVAFLTISAHIAITAVKKLAHQLNDKLDSTERFWPGTKSYKFKKETKNCPTCKEILG